MDVEVDGDPMVNPPIDGPSRVSDRRMTLPTFLQRIGGTDAFWSWKAIANLKQML